MTVGPIKARCQQSSHNYHSMHQETDSQHIGFHLRSTLFRLPFARRAYERFFWRMRRNRSPQKVFLIGFMKTVTSSIGRSLRQLGFAHNDLQRFADHVLFSNGRYDELIAFSRKFESFEDLPWSRPEIIRLMDQTFPGSKWIYSERDEESWKKSWVSWNRKRGRIVDAEEGWDHYQEHKKFVLNYFEEREDFIRICVSDPKDFDRMAEFLGKSAPGRVFPRVNVTTN